MTTSRLIITSVRADPFGRWQGRTLDLLDGAERTGHGDTDDTPGPGMTVVFGPNQAGKSTFATLIGWLLAGPGQLNAGDVPHLGEAGATLGGTLEGRLGPTPFSAQGSFKLLKNRPIRTELRVREESSDGTVTHDLESWTNRLGRVDAEVIDAVHFIWGGDLHGMANIDTQLKAMSMGQLRGRDPRVAIAALDGSARRNGKGGAKGDVSVATVKKALVTVDAELREAEANTDLFARTKAALSEAERLSTSADDQLKTCQARTRTIEHAISATATMRTIRDLTLQLDGLPVITQEWIEVIAEIPRLVDLHDALVNMEDDVLTNDRRLARTVEGLGTSVATLAQVRISDADLSTTTRLATKWSDARTALETAEALVGSADEDLEEARSQMVRALGHLDGVGVEDLADVRLGSPEHNSIIAAIGEAQTAAGSASDAITQLQLAKITRDAVVSAHERELATWHDLAGEGDPAQWMAAAMTHQTRGDGTASGSLATSPTTRSGLTRWIGVLALVTMALVAAVTHQWPLAVFAVVAAAITAVVQLRRYEVEPVAGHGAGDVATDGIDRSSIGRFSVDTATSVINTGRAAQTAEDHVAELEQRAQQHAELAERAVENMRLHAASFGVSLKAPLPAVRAELDQWSDAVAAVARYESSQLAHRGAVADRDALGHELADLEQQMSDHLDSMGVPSACSLADAPDVIDSYRSAIADLQNATGSRRTLDDLEHQWLGLTEPVAAQITTWSRQRVLEEVQVLAEASKDRSILQRRIDDATIELGDIPDGSPLASIIASDPSESELEAMFEESKDDEDRAAASSKDYTEQAGALRTDLDRLSSVTAVARLTASRGALIEQQQELAIEAAAAALAARILGDVAEDHQRRNQPALVRTTTEIAASVTDEWESIRLSPFGDHDDPVLIIDQRSGGPVPAVKLSTGARGLLQLSLRIALARGRASSSDIAIPLVCDDPFVHFSDDWARAGMELLNREADDRQVIMFTCHSRSLRAARDLGANIVELNG